jgi:hypothetical protein
MHRAPHPSTLTVDELNTFMHPEAQRPDSMFAFVTRHLDMSAGNSITE